MQTRRLTALAAFLVSVAPLSAEEPAFVAPAPFRAEDATLDPISTRHYFTADSPSRSLERSRRRWKKAWIASWVAYAAVNVLDAHSSLGHGEANPLLRGSNGTFASGKAAAVKGALGAGFFLWQQRTIRKNRDRNDYKTFTFATAGAAGAMGAVAAHNYTLK